MKRFAISFVLILSFISLITIICFLSNTVRAGTTDTILLWDTTETSPGSSASNQAKLPLESTGTYSFNVSWGDETYDIITAWDQVNVTHTYASSGSKTITINGTCYGFCFNNTGDIKKLREVNQWGNLRVGNTGGYFYGSKFIRIYATDSLDLTGTTTLAHMFDGAEYINDASVGNWDTKNITDMQYLFHNAFRFNQNIGNWNVGNVTCMIMMFASDTSSATFNQNLGSWNVSKVTNMYGMFSRTAFNYDIGNWDVSNVTSTANMFSFTSAFNKSIDNWSMSKVTDISYMFYEASAFSKDLNSWDVANVTNMWSTFRLAVKFNGNISNWNTGKVTNFDAMFQQAFVFNQNIGGWDTHLVTNMEETFDYANTFNQNLGGWDVKNVTVFSDMFFNCSISTPNYDGILVGWASQSVQNGKSINFGYSKYTASPGAGGVAREHLVSVHFWTITDGGSIPYNYPVVFSSPHPENGSTGNPTAFVWNITTTDQNGDTFNWWINCSNSDTNSSAFDTNGSKELYISGLDYSTRYWVNVTATDGNETTTAWYTFNTTSNQKPVFKNPYPVNGTTELPFYTNIVWNITIEDIEGDVFNWSIQSSIGNSSNSNDTNESKIVTLIRPLYNTTYIIYVNASDGTSSTNATYLLMTYDGIRTLNVSGQKNVLQISSVSITVFNIIGASLIISLIIGVIAIFVKYR